MKLIQKECSNLKLNYIPLSVQKLLENFLSKVDKPTLPKFNKFVNHSFELKSYERAINRNIEAGYFQFIYGNSPSQIISEFADNRKLFREMVNELELIRKQGYPLRNLALIVRYLTINKKITSAEELVTTMKERKIEYGKIIKPKTCRRLQYTAYLS